MDDLDRTVLDSVDHRLDPLVPTGPAPVADLVRRGRARRTRRRGLQAGLVAAVVVAATATTTAVVQGRDAAPGPADPAASTPPPTPTVTDGTTRAIGFDGVVVDVPGDWVQIEQCPSSQDGVAFGQRGASCSSSLQVQLVPLASPVSGGVQERRGDLAVRRIELSGSGSGCGPNDSCELLPQTVQLVVDERVLILIAAPPGYEEVDRMIDESVRPLPSGSVVVPDLVGLGLDDAKAVLTEAGLDAPDGEPLYVIARTEPEAGSVVPAGAGVALYPMVPPPPVVDPVPDGFRLQSWSGVSVAVPEDWVPCVMVSLLGQGPGFGPRGPDGGCDAGTDGQVSDLISFDTRIDADMDVRDTAVVERGGLAVQDLSGCGPQASCVGPAARVRAVEKNVVIRVHSGSPALLDAVVGSVRETEAD